MIRRTALVALLALALSASLRAAPDAKPAVVTIGDNERVVHVVGSVFTHSYYEPRLETLLLRLGGARGLTFRQIEVGGPVSVLDDDFAAKVLDLKPTLVVLQVGTEVIMRQYRRQTYDFITFPKALDPLVAKLRAAGCRVVLCSATPVGNGSAPDKLLPPNDGLKTWTDAARDVAARHGAIYADLFSAALAWPMIGNDPRSRYYYPPEGHEKSWNLLLSQVSFQPATPAATDIDAKALQGRASDGEIAGLKSDAGVLAFTLKARSSGGAHTLKVTGLPPGAYQITAYGKPALKASADELAAGLDIGPLLRTLGSAKELKDESAAGRAAFAALTAVRQYNLPPWITLPDFDRQKAAALAKAQDTLSTHDATAARLASPAPLPITITPAK